ncbi:MAG TPA: hypothetical protein VI522_03565 [Gammaproteobacteria bacterium]|nr:hypothetical protein [Gammaproteobacteria bacterium]
MVFSFHIAFGVLLIALVSGMFLYYKAKKNDSGVGKFLGIVIALFALAHLVCTGYYGISYWKQGMYQMPMPMMMHQMMDNKGGMKMGNQSEPNMPAKQ